MHLLSTLFFVTARFNFWFTAIHLPDERNIAADFISKNKIYELPVVAPYLSHHPYVIPQDILHLLYNEAPDWTFRVWAPQFNTCLGTPQPDVHVNLPKNDTWLSAKLTLVLSHRACYAYTSPIYTRTG